MAPSNVVSTTGTNNANYYNTDWADPINLLTPVGAFASSPGPYGTFDQAGLLDEWTDGTIGVDSRILRRGRLPQQCVLHAINRQGRDWAVWRV